MTTSRPQLAVIGAGWAGLAAAIIATQSGCRVTLFEAARQPGGRARSLGVRLADGTQATLDNGQHILIGAYTQTLALMHEVGVDPLQVLHAMPLSLRDAAGRGLALASLPPPWDVLAGVLRASGWTLRDRIALLAAALRWRRVRFACAPGTTVGDLARTLPPRVQSEFIEPLCVAALNTPPADADAGVFLRVLQDALLGPGWGPWRGSTLLLPRVPLGALLPDAAIAWLRARGADLRLGARVQALRGDGRGTGWRVEGEPFDAALIATGAPEAARLVADSGIEPAWAEQAAALRHEPIGTVYIGGAPRLPQPMLALQDGPAQFVFDRSQLGGPSGVLAFVASACAADRHALEAAVLAQAGRVAPGAPLQVLQTVVERRATFACTPRLRRPPAHIAPGLWACGDHVEGPYPATLEGAVRSARQAVDAVLSTRAARTAR